MIELTEQQQKEILQAKSEKFRAGMALVEKETGMTVIPYINWTPQGAKPELLIVQIKNETQPSINITRQPSEVVPDKQQTVDKKIVAGGKKKI